MISKDILKQYSDLQKEIVEVRQRIETTEKQIQQIEEEGTVFDTVRGGMGGTQHFKIEGVPYPEFSRKKSILYSRKATLASLEAEIAETLNKVEEFISGISDSRMRRIITMRYIENKTWNQIADQIGGGNTEGSIKMAFQRFMDP